MIFGLFGLGFTAYCLSALVSYDGEMPFGHKIAWAIVLGVLTNILWMFVAHFSENNHERYLNAWLWDAMICFTFAMIPLFFSDLTLTPKNGIGVVLTLIGLALLR